MRSTRPAAIGLSVALHACLLLALWRLSGGTREAGSAANPVISLSSVPFEEAQEQKPEPAAASPAAVPEQRPSEPPQGGLTPAQAPEAKPADVRPPPAAT